MPVKSMKQVALTLLSNVEPDDSPAPVADDRDTNNGTRKGNPLCLETVGRYEVWEGRSCFRVYCVRLYVGESDKPAEFATFEEALAYARGEHERDIEELQHYLAIRTPRTPAMPPKPPKPRKSAR
jgi:hypothetical protein